LLAGARALMNQKPTVSAPTCPGRYVPGSWNEATTPCGIVYDESPVRMLTPKTNIAAVSPGQRAYMPMPAWSTMQTIMTHIVCLALGEGADFMSRALSQVVRKLIVGELRGETAGKILEIGIGEGAGDGMEINDVADHEPVMPSARLQTRGVLKRHCPHAFGICQLNRYPPGL
jgi:hypothetical protein